MEKLLAWDGFLVYNLRYLSDGSVKEVSEIRLGVANMIGLTVEQRTERIPSGKPKAGNLIDWIIFYLTRVGALNRPARARYQITPIGADLLARFPVGIRAEIIRKMAKPGDEWWLSKHEGRVVDLPGMPDTTTGALAHEVA